MLTSLIFILLQGQISFNQLAKSAFDSVKIDCNFEAVYAKSIKDNKVIILSVGTAKPDLGTLPWTILEVEAITGEKPGYIVGVPKNGKLVRLDFAIGTPRQRMRLDVLHVYYPLTNGYVECPTCPYGRSYVGR